MTIALKRLEHRLAFDLRGCWQARMLRFTKDQGIGAVVLSMLAHTYDAGPLETLLKVEFPGFKSLKPPFLCSAGQINKYGRVVADMVVDERRKVVKDVVVARSVGELKERCRRLADAMKLDDADRIEFFKIVRAWVVADRRLDPTMDPRDPDARRLVLH